MAIFAVIAPGEAPQLKAAIASQFPDHYFEVAAGQYLISAPKATTVQVSEKLGVQKGEVGKAMILHVTNWNGWHSRNLWEWLTAQDKANLPGGEP